MSTISLRLNEEDYRLIQNYVGINHLNLSSFAREAIMEKVEQDLALDEDRILSARTRALHEASYDHTEVWKELGI